MSMTNPCIVFATTCKGRTQHLKETLPRNIGDNADYPNCHFLVLDYGSTDDLLDYLSGFQHPGLAAGPERLLVYSLIDSGPFKMAHAKNTAHRLGILHGADVLVNLDADNFTGAGFARYIADQFEENPDVFLWANRNQPAAVRYPKGCNGRIVVSRNAFLKAGGYNEQRYNTWGPDDKDFHFRLRRLGMVPSELPRRYLDVILHSDKMRFRDYPEVAEACQYEQFQAVDESATIANFGQFGMGTLQRRLWPDLRSDRGAWPVHLRALPTRLFGIGMHKTATTSLNAALRQLGFDTAHWKSAHWAKAIWREMNNLGKSATLERSYAMSDLPFPLMYDRLDKAYPGSKFILTTRDEEDWLESVRRHYDADYNPYRHMWDTDPFTHIIHKRLYGREDFDAETCRARYRRHNAEVKQYFKNRPADLLVMEMDYGDGWEELCEFLDCPIPERPYPLKFITQNDGKIEDMKKAKRTKNLAHTPVESKPAESAPAPAPEPPPKKGIGTGTPRDPYRES